MLSALKISTICNSPRCQNCSNWKACQKHKHYCFPTFPSDFKYSKSTCYCPQVKFSHTVHPFHLAPQRVSLSLSMYLYSRGNTYQMHIKILLCVFSIWSIINSNIWCDILLSIDLQQLSWDLERNEQDLAIPLLHRCTVASSKYHT